MPPVENIVPAAELRQEAPKAVPSTEGLPPPMDDNAVRAIFEQAAAKGIDDLNATITTAAPLGQPPVPAAPVIQAPIPEKFQRPHGTVDEEKLRASSAQLDVAIQEKQKTIDELLSDYKTKEKEFHGVSQDVRKAQAAAPTPAPMGPPVDQEMEAVRQQLLQLQRNDPIAFAVEIARAVSRKEATDIAGPALQVTQALADRERDANVRSNIAALAEQDPRILHPQVYTEVMKELNSDPAYFRLKNPHKAAWNEVKERMRLGDAPLRQAQPSNPGPILGRGSPTPVSGLSQPVTSQSLSQQVGQTDPSSEDGKRLEAQLRALSEQVWRP